MDHLVKKSVKYRVLPQIPESPCGELRLRSIAQVLAAAADRDAVTAEWRSAEGALWPRITLSTGADYLDGQQVGSFGEVRDTEFARFEPAASIGYNINPGAALARADEASHLAEAASLEVREASRQAVLQAGLAYFDIVLARESHGIATALASNAERVEEITGARVEAEINAAADLARAEAEAARARQIVALTRSRWEQASARLAALLRWPPQQLLVPDRAGVEPLTLVEQTDSAEMLLAANAVRPDIAAASARAAAAAARSSAAWWELLGPDVELSIGSRVIGTDKVGADDTAVVRAFLTMSFGFEELGQLRAARNRKRSAQIRERELRETMAGEIEAAIARNRGARAAIPEARRAADAAVRGYHAQLARFKAGTGFGLELIAAQNSAARAQLERIESVIRFNAAQMELAALIGDLEALIQKR